MVLSRLILLMLALACLAPAALAGTVHEIRFAQTERVLVWQDGTFIGEGAQVALNETHSAPAIAMMGSGTLEPVRVSFTEAAQSTTIELASNTGFAIIADDFATASRVEVSVLGAGANAMVQPNTSQGAGLVVFEQVGKTARRPGEARSQAVTLQVSWTGNVAPRLMVRATGS